MRARATKLFLLTLLAATGCTPAAAPPTVQTVAGPEVQGGAWFTQSGCTTCHSVSAYNLSNVTAQAPDLSLAVEDVPRRFGMTLDQFFRAPVGTMAMVLSTRIRMTDADRALAIARLEEADRAHRTPAIALTAAGSSH